MTSQSKHIVLVTTTHLSTNPRLLKEANALSAQGYRVTVLSCYTIKWGYDADQRIIKEAPFNTILVGGTPNKNLRLWHYGRLRRKTCSWFPFIPACRIRMFARAYDELLSAAIQLKADLYIGHNLGTLPVVANAAKKHGVPYAFDAEDFHREEAASDAVSNSGKWKRLIEERYFPGAAYITAASPLIGAEYQKHFPGQTVAVINNVFSKARQPPFRNSTNGPLKLFWFSQTIGTDRGLDDVLNAMQHIPEIPILLTLLGRCSDSLKQYFESKCATPNHTIRIHDPIEPDQIFTLDAEQDIGLALESGVSLNRNIALTNKIFTYLLAGNAVLVSETPAQKNFIQEYPSTGLSYPIGDIQSLANHLTFFYQNRQTLQHARRSAWQLAHDTLNWEEEQKKLIKLIESIWR
jgi:glycosyltransferase involved in cell wall biosynthesis